MSTNDNKLKLNQLWDEIKMNLPEVNFNENNDELDSTEAQPISSSQNLDLDSIDFLNDDDRDDFNPSSPKWQECEKNFEKYLKKDDQATILMNEESDVSLSEDSKSYSYESQGKLDIKQQNSLNDFLTECSKSKTKKPTRSNEQAVNITKNLFETTSYKLSMGIFESINIDDLLNSVEEKTTGTAKIESKFLDYTPNKLPTASRLVNDENVLMKLAQLSQSISKDEELSSLNLQTGAIIPVKSKSTSTGMNTDDLSTESMLSAFNLIENEMKNNKQVNYNLSENVIKNDLSSFLKTHNIIDGNLVATRRIDLRQNQQSIEQTNKQPAEILMQNILDSNDDEKYFRNKSKEPIKFLNDSELSSSSSDSDSDDDRSILWIERYRRQKMNNLNNFFSK